ncbi:MAG: glycosyltransferase family 2 protein [Candidatus Tyrphobacter sp.]
MDARASALDGALIGMPPDLSVVIPAHNNWWLTRRCLGALDALRSSSAVRFETIVVDDASSDETPLELASYDWVRRMRLDVNANFGGATTAGARIAQAPIVLFLNNDAWPLGDALPPLVAAFSRPEVAIAGAALFYEDGVTQGAGCVLLPNAHWFLSYRSLPATLDAVRTPRDAIVVPGAAIAVRRDWFLAGGGFDPLYRNGFEDTDLCMRARSEGLVTRYVAESRFAHYEGATTGRFTWEEANEIAFYRRWSPALSSIERTERGEVSAIVVHRGPSDPLGEAVLEDVLEAIRSYGHPVVDAIAPWHRFDRRFRIAASLAWNCDGAAFAPSVEVACESGSVHLKTHGAIGLCVPWMPCAEPRRAGAPRPSGSDLYGYVALLDAYAGKAGEEARQDALRRGAPRRSAMRVIDLARVARFGLERSGRAVSNAPIRISA